MTHEKKIVEFLGDNIKFDDYGAGYFWACKGDGIQMIAEVRGWGAIQNMFNTEKEAEQFQDELGEWIADAINQKLQKQKS
jgi:hypothetical protein